MIDLEELYFDWLLGRLSEEEGVEEGVAYLCGLLQNCEFKRRVGNDSNRATDGINLRKEFLTQFEDANFGPNVTNELMMQSCSWFEMLVALSRGLDFLYDGGVENRFIELITNANLLELALYTHPPVGVQVRRDQRHVDIVVSDIDDNLFEPNGEGGLFPLQNPDHHDQRGVEIWDQAGAYFNERLEGVRWTSTS